MTSQLNSMPLISVIVPVYNVRPFLECCLKSVLKQSYSNWECILVDDGSTDGSDVICDAYTKIDPRILCIHKKNGGLSDARNFGIEHATGDYLFFLDSDDYILPNTLLNLVKDALIYYADNSNVMVVGAYDTIFDNGKEFTCNDLGMIRRLNSMEGVEYFYKCSNPNISTVSAWGKLFSRNLFNSVSFPLGKLHEDVFILHRFWYEADMIIIDERISYIYRQSIGSITRSSFNVRRLDIIEASFEQLHYFKNIGIIKYMEYAWNQLLYNFYHSFRGGAHDNCFSDKVFSSHYKNYVDNFKTEWKQDTRRNKLSLKTRIKVTLFFISSKLFYKILNLYIVFSDKSKKSKRIMQAKCIL